MLLRIWKLNKFIKAGHCSVLAHTVKQLKHSGCKPKRFPWKLTDFFFIVSVLLLPDISIIKVFWPSNVKQKSREL